MIDINCGSENHAARFDQSWRGSHLKGDFQFHLTRQVTLRIGIFAVDGVQELDYVFDHMVYVCSLLSSEAKSIRKLTVEFSCGLEDWEQVNTKCTCFFGVESSGYASQFGLDVTPPSERMEERVKFFLQPLALPGRVAEFEVDLPGRLSQDEGLQRLAQYYKDAVTTEDQSKRISYKKSLWLWNRYTELCEG